MFSIPIQEIGFRLPERIISMQMIIRGREVTDRWRPPDMATRTNR
jgi:hypothetical protein